MAWGLNKINMHLIVRSRNKSCAELRKLEIPRRCIYRMGSATPTYMITKRHDYIEINKPEACARSNDKREMKKRFTRSNIPCAEWFMVKKGDRDLEKINHYLNKWETLIAKKYNSSKGDGIYLIKSIDDAKQIAENDNIEKYIFERYYTYKREYRIHVTKNGYFHASRKMLKEDAKERWHRHGMNSVYIKEDNPMFDKPKSWDKIITACVNALKCMELDIAAFDVKVQGNEWDDPKFIVLESNSAPALGVETIEKYKNQILKLIENA